MSPQQCARPGCAGKAAAWLAYDYKARCAWLDDQDLAEDDRASRWALCQHHADRLRVPRGWFSVDRRSQAAVPGPEAQQTAVPGPDDPEAPEVPRPAGWARAKAPKTQGGSMAAAL